MADRPLEDLTATEAAVRIRERAISPVELVEALLRRADAVDGQVQAWETLDAERALAAARTAEQAVGQGADLGPLHGVPFGAKDIVDTAGLRTAAGFPPYDERVPTEDAEVVQQLKAAGAILLGKLATTQFAFMDPARTRNPWAADRTPGGSSSGSGAGVAAREVPLALGSQTGGSILRPAAYNGVVGFKPTLGRVSTRGVLPLAWSLDHVGVLTRAVDDCALFLRIAGGAAPANEPVAAPRVGLLREAVDRAAPAVREHVETMARRFEQAGASVREAGLHAPWDLYLAVHHLIMQSETSGVHWQLLEQYPGAHQPRLRAYVEVGRLIPAPLYLHAQRLRRRLRAAAAESFRDVDVLLLLTVADVAPARDTTGDPSLQSPFSLLGLPAISLPGGRAESGLPLAVQLVGPAGADERLLAVARWCEERIEPLPAPPVS